MLSDGHPVAGFQFGHVAGHELRSLALSRLQGRCIERPQKAGPVHGIEFVEGFPGKPFEQPCVDQGFRRRCFWGVWVWFFAEPGDPRRPLKFPRVRRIAAA